MRGYPVSNRVNSVVNDDEECFNLWKLCLPRTGYSQRLVCLHTVQVRSVHRSRAQFKSTELKRIRM